MSSKFFPDRVLFTLTLGTFISWSACLSGVTLEMGRPGEVLQHQIETPNILIDEKATLQWNPFSPNISFPKIEPGIIPSVIPVIPELLVKFNTLITNPNFTLASSTGNSLPVKDILVTEEATTQTGLGTSEKTAKRDGPATLEVYLPTHNPATIEVRIINEDNTEELYSGDSLLTWTRPNDKARALVRFKGADQPNSMFLSKNGDWSPNPLKYVVDLKAGQRMILSVSGNPDPGAFVRVTSAAF